MTDGLAGRGGRHGVPGAASTLTYGLLRAVSRLLLGLFYRGIEVVGREHVPRAGALMVAANHGNALVDPMLLLTAIPRRLTPIAKTALFRHPLIGPFLRLIHALPVTRRQDSGAAMAANADTFAAAARALGAGGAILIFPEGVSQPEPVLMPLRTGAARMLLAAQAVGAGEVKLLPVGLVFDTPGLFRAGWALVRIGEPVPTADCARQAASEPEAAVRELTDRLAEALRRLVVEAGDRETLALLRVVEDVWREDAAGAGEAAASAARRQQAMRAYRYLLPRAPARLHRLRGQVTRYARILELAGLDGAPAAAPPSPFAIGRYVLREGLALFLGLPLALVGVIVHGVPYQLTALAVRIARPEADVVATIKILGAFLIYPLVWIAEAIAVERLLGPWALVVFCLLLVPVGFFALSWSERLSRVMREGRAWARLLRRRDLRAHLIGEREAIRAELQSLVRLVPDAVLAGAEEAR
ncbi:MAG: 1-acyl-sn-glycerol-3-phosphate acyltransferase [Candidatus Rokubacteria bacterium]|nr:1-acyl-sn-glycerol-3-phosphate acyltransferase [Candidatus Rokubacteria bacterium]